MTPKESGICSGTCLVPGRLRRAGAQVGDVEGASDLRAMLGTSSGADMGDP